MPAAPALATGSPPPNRAPARGQPASSHTAPPAITIGQQPAGLDNATWLRFRTGKLAAARTLDLHGRTAHRAYHALESFLRGAHGDRLRCVEIITGRGTGQEGGVLKRELPLWLNLAQLRPIILAAVHPHPANPGSVRLLLRRVR
jgi:DNA-nicking Smr family endonuclease